MNLHAKNPRRHFLVIAATVAGFDWPIGGGPHGRGSVCLDSSE